MIQLIRVESNKEIADGIFETVFEPPENLPEIHPGQFMNIYPKNPSLTLPRPVSLCDVCGGRLKIVYRVVGRGTREFSGYSAGETVKVMLPLGNGFNAAMASGKRCVLVGGGLGVPPLVYLAKRLKAQNAAFSVFLGFADKPFLLNDLNDVSTNVFIASETGAYGEKGNVLDLLRKHDDDGELYFCCGPAPMLKAVCGYITERDADGQVSLEQRMACGFGACVGCAVKIKDGDGWQYMKACKDGPVFGHGVVLWD